MQTCHATTRRAPCRVLFLNTQHHIGADLGVHLMLLRHLDPAETQAGLISNCYGPAVSELQERIGGGAAVAIRQLPFGKHAGAAGRNAALASLAPLASSLLRAAAMIRRGGIQIIHATDRPRDAACAAVLGGLTGASVVVHMHSNCGSHLGRLTRWGLRRATAVFAVSAYIRRELIAFGLDPQRVFVVHNAVDTDYFAPEPFHATRAEVRHRYGVPADAPLIGVVARLNPWKGQQELIDALALLTPDLPSLRLLVVGAGPEAYETTLREQAHRRNVASRVIFTGLQRDVRPLLASLDLFSLPSYEEPFGLAIIEAMAMGLPVIACRSGGVPEIITDEQDGCLVPPRSPEAIAGAIRRLAANADLRNRLGARARHTARARFAPEVQAQQISRLYMSLTVPAAVPAARRNRLADPAVRRRSGAVTEVPES